MPAQGQPVPVAARARLVRHPGAWRLSLTKSLLLAVLLLVGGAASAAVPGPAVQAEISHLLTHLGNSGCTFYRNGSWHSASQARAHLEKKRDYLLQRSLIGSTEDFIDRAATASSMTGEKYLVRCASAQPVASAEWLRAELTRFRATAAPPGG
jgi:hypothetical protein